MFTKEIFRQDEREHGKSHVENAYNNDEVENRIHPTNPHHKAIKLQNIVREPSAFPHN